MTTTDTLLAQLRAINQAAAFNQWCGIEVLGAQPGRAEIAMPWRAEAGQYAGFLHAGLVGALIATACGIAAVTSSDGRVLITMPHPERSFRVVQNSWYPPATGEYSGWMRMFRNARRWVG